MRTLCSFLLVTVTTLQAADIAVGPNGGSLQDAVARASSGDTLILQPGTYREWVRIDKALSLRGTDGAVLDGAQDLNANWRAEGDGVFTAPLESRPDGLLLDGRFIAELRFDRAQAKGDWHWRTLLAEGPPLSGFEQIRALWMYHPHEQRLYARFPNAVAPDGLALSWLPSDEPLLTIAADGVVVEGLTFAHGSSAVVITNHAAEAVVRHCVIRSYEGAGIVLTGGASRCSIEDCRDYAWRLGRMAAQPGT